MANSARIDELRKKFDENPRRYFAPLANEYRKAGDQEQAIFICQEYLPQQPGHMSGHIVYGQALFELNRFDEAKAVFETALSLDPENLIALRHLGDIARQASDFPAARSWYQRVLEADPRNEEIAQLMLSLLGNEPTSSGSPAVDHNAPTPLSTPTVTQPAAARDEHAFAHDVGGFVVEKSPDETGVAPEQEAEPAIEPESAPAAEFVSFAPPEQPPELPPELPPEPLPIAEEPPIPSAPSASESHELMDLDDFSIGGMVASVSAEPPAEEPRAEPSTLDGPSDFGFNLGEEDGPFEADPFAIAAQPSEPASEPGPEPAPVAPDVPQPEIELAADLDIGLPDDSPLPPPIVAEDSSHEDVEAAPVSGLETFDAAAPEAAPLDIVAFDATPLSTGVVSAPIDGGDEGAQEGAHDGQETPTPEAFVTETMAELYLRQGHLESALEIYRKLVDARPSDSDLGDRMRAVELRLYGPSESIDEPVAEPAPAGPTIREFLQSLVRARAVEAVESIDVAAEPLAEAPAETPAETPAEVPEAPYGEPLESDVQSSVEFEEFSQEELLPPIEPDEWQHPPVSRATPTAAETVSGSIDALFTGAEASNSDTNAASRLAEAFAPDGPETAPLHGVPAHRASSELSLDHVFKTGTPPRGENTDAFSFDQFFSEEMTQASPANDAENGAAPREAPDDIAQFNAWLNGLKKT